MKKTVNIIFTVMILLLFNGCVNAKDATEEIISEKDVKVIYEAFYLDNDEILELFSEVRGQRAPHEYVTKDFHVTTVFMPEHDMHEFYGTEVTVHIYAYQDGEVKADDGKLTANEGFFCNITTENDEMQRYIDDLEKNWHITGSYKDQGGAKYTGNLELTDAQKLDYTVKGRFGGFMSDGNIIFSME